MLEVKNLSCQKGYNLLFQDLTFYLKSGDVARILGDNGSGKTSLLKILAGISSFETGKVLLNTHTIKSEAYTKDVLYLGHNSLISGQLSVIENLDFLAKLCAISATHQQLITALSHLKLEHYAHEFGNTLSAGQKRKIILSLLFLSKSKLWLLDEPFTALDVSSVAIIEEAINTHLTNGGMCILTTHQTCRLSVMEIKL